MSLDLVRRIVAALGTHKEAAEKTGIPYATLQRVLSGSSPLTHERLSKIALATGLSMEQMATLQGAVAGTMSPEQLAVARGAIGHLDKMRPKQAAELQLVPLYDIAVSAGHGVAAIEAGQSVESLGFPEGWLRRQFRNTRQLRIFNVRGDSMIPAMADGDLVMVDTSNKDRVDGVFVLRLDDQLLVKRLFFPSERRVLMTSDNKDYERQDRVIDLADEAKQSAFGLIGRVVWVGKAL